MNPTQDANAGSFGAEEKKVTIGLVQTSVSENIADNMKKTERKIVEAASKGAQIVCLQELYRTRYFPQQEKLDAAKLAETIPGESTEAFAQLAKDKEIVIIAPLFEVSNGKCYNSAAVIDADGKLLGSYRKIHVPQGPVFLREKLF